MILESSCFNLSVRMKTNKYGCARPLLLEQSTKLQESISHNITDYKVPYHSVFQARGKRSNGMVKQHTLYRAA